MGQCFSIILTQFKLGFRVTEVFVLVFHFLQNFVSVFVQETKSLDLLVQLFYLGTVFVIAQFVLHTFFVVK